MEQIQAIPQTDTPPTTPTEQTLNRLSRCISMILHPLTIPLWAGIILLFGNTLMASMPINIKWFFLAVLALNTWGIPAFCIGMLRMFHLATIDPHVNRTAGICQLSDDAFGCHDRLSDPTLPGRCHWLCVDRLDRYAFLENQPPHDLDGRITRSAVCVTNGWFGTTVPSFADLHSVDRTSRKCPPLVRQP